MIRSAETRRIALPHSRVELRCSSFAGRIGQLTCCLRFLWHGNVYKALQVVQSVEMELDATVATSGHDTARKRLKAVEEFHT